MTKKLCKKNVRFISSSINLNDTYIVSAVRTPIGSFQGKLASLSAVQLGSRALKAAVEASGVCKEDIQELLLGCMYQCGLGQGPARQISIFSDLPHSVSCSSINKLCASGMKAIMFGCQTITSNANELIAVVGAESITNVPYILKRKRLRLGNLTLSDVIIHDGLIDIFEQIDVTHFAEQTVKEFNETRETQDEYALQSYARAAAATEEGIFKKEIVPVVIDLKDGQQETICEDEEIRRLNITKFKKLVPDMGKDGTITVGNSSTLNDGAAAMILASGNYVLKKNLQPIARVVSYAEGGVDPKKFCVAPAVAIPRALLKAHLTTDHICLWEISETFAITATANTKILRLDPSRVNIHGGAISLGHPFGMTGVRVTAHLAHCLEPGQLGCASVSHATGGATAIIIEKI